VEIVGQFTDLILTVGIHDAIPLIIICWLPCNRAAFVCMVCTKFKNNSLNCKCNSLISRFTKTIDDCWYLILQARCGQQRIERDETTQ